MPKKITNTNPMGSSSKDVVDRRNCNNNSKNNNNVISIYLETAMQVEDYIYNLLTLPSSKKENCIWQIATYILNIKLVRSMIWYKLGCIIINISSVH